MKTLRFLSAPYIFTLRPPTYRSLSVTEVQHKYVGVRCVAYVDVFLFDPHHSNHSNHASSFDSILLSALVVISCCLS